MLREASIDRVQERSPSHARNELLQTVVAKIRRFHFERELDATERMNATADVIFDTDWNMFRVLSVNRKLEPSPKWLPLGKFSETLTNRSVMEKKLAVVIVPGFGPMKPQLFDFVQAFRTNGFTEVVMEVSYHGQLSRVDAKVFGF
jgi:hypothetical protein